MDSAYGLFHPNPTRLAQTDHPTRDSIKHLSPLGKGALRLWPSSPSLLPSLVSLVYLLNYRKVNPDYNARIRRFTKTATVSK